MTYRLLKYIYYFDNISPVQVLAATSENLNSIDWNLNLSIVDQGMQSNNNF